MGPCIQNYLTVGCWNLEGIYEKVNGAKLCKLDDDIFRTTLKKFDVLCLQKTHVSQDETINGFCITPHCWDISGNNRYFGGMLIFVRDAIKKGIKIGKKSDKDLLEIILKKFFLACNRT